MVRLVASHDAKQEFIISVSWRVLSKIKIQANSLEEALSWAKENIDEIPLDNEWDYEDGSYQIDAENPEDCEIYNS